MHLQVGHAKALIIYHLVSMEVSAKKRQAVEGKLAGKVALVTGAAQGIGEATARVSCVSHMQNLRARMSDF